ncbi:MAG: CDP-diacylglycerol--serine O-phosphatidyltransferase [Proteobacteria bacterium]|jgi:CDP-diacylglycerol--serine O-phosphatidyltransferase|nr:MAG: CDP-diacylglycerol--serine O-phosphatidyltransferase [Pseudomonadota bacterium]
MDTMDPLVTRLEEETRRRRRRPLFKYRQVPVRMLIPNFFTLVGLCAGLTAIRMAIEGRYELALAAIVFAALLDGVDGRVARLLKASSRFGAEFDSLADFVNFGVAPAIVLFTWGAWETPGMRGLAWIVVLLLAVACGLRLARFNAVLDVERPKWQSNYFSGVPAPAGAIIALLPVYLEQLGLLTTRSGWAIYAMLAYILLVAFLMVSTIPTYSGKLLGERISREWVMPAFVLAGALVALLVTYPYATLSIGTLLYLAMIPVSVRRFRAQMQLHGEEEARPNPALPAVVVEHPKSDRAHR